MSDADANRAKAHTLRTEGKSVQEIATILNLSRVSIYKYLKNPESRIGADASMGESFEMEMLRIELDATKRQLELYKKETARLLAILES